MAGFNRHAVEVGVFVAIGDILIFRHFMPAVADIRTAPAFNSDIEGSERMALGVATIFTGAVALFVKSWDTFLVGGIVTIALDMSYKHANAISPETGSMAQPPGSQPIGENDAAYSLPDYGMAAASG